MSLRILLVYFTAVIIGMFIVLGGIRGKVGSDQENIKSDVQLMILDEDGNTILTTDHITSAKAGQYDLTETSNYVTVILTEEGKELFADATKRLIGHRLSIYLGDECIMSPVVQTPITDGQVMITGLESLQEAEELAEILNKTHSSGGIFLFP